MTTKNIGAIKTIAPVRVFDSSYLQDNRPQFRAFDSALLQASGWGSDPTARSE